MNIIKKIRVKEEGGTLSEEYDIGVSAIDIDLSYNESKLENTLKKKPYYYSCVARMKQDESLIEGDYAMTFAYYLGQARRRRKI